MRETIDRWGERTICRVEFDEKDGGGLEMILRLKGDFRSVEREELVLFLEKVIQILYGHETDLKGTVRTVAYGKAKKKLKPHPLSDAQRDILRTIVTGLHERLNLDGRKELSTFLKELVDQL